MTKHQGTALISIGVALSIVAILAMILVPRWNNSMKRYVKQEISKYDSTVTKKNQEQFDMIIDGLHDIKTKINE